MENQAPRQKRSPSREQAGNALIYTLIVIVLLAALGVVLTRSASKSTGNLSAEHARMSAERLMRSAQSLEGAVQKIMQVNGCGENEISFENSSMAAYVNANSPTDKRCHVFSAAGAGLSYSAPDANALDISHSAQVGYGLWVIHSQQCILEIGTGDSVPCTAGQSELIASVLYVSKQVCIEINNLAGITNPAGDPPQEDFDHDGAAFIGTFEASVGDPEIGDTGTGTNLVGKKSGCLLDTAGVNSGSYIFYYALLER
jgi:type II secretory pathway pseudopilin PulG